MVVINLVFLIIFDMVYGHRNNQVNPLKGIGYLILCALFGYAFFVLGNGFWGPMIEDFVLSAICWFITAFVWCISIMILHDLFKYFKSN